MTNTAPPSLEPRPTSESEEMYLITVARAAEGGVTGPVPLASVAETLGVSVASANEMVRKLTTRGLLTYEPYHGTALTPAGAETAGRVLRIRRLWATFLAQHLGFSPAQADEQACDLEHVTTPDAAARLAVFLGHPESGPLGRPIPDGAVTASSRLLLRVTDLSVGERAEVTAVDASVEAAGFLAAEGLKPGSLVTVAGAGRSGVLLDLGQAQLHLDADLAASIEVRRSSESDGRRDE